MKSNTIVRTIRVRKEDSAYVYSILESHEGIASYSTLAGLPADPHRDLVLTVPVAFASELDSVLRRLGDLVYELK